MLNAVGGCPVWKPFGPWNSYWPRGSSQQRFTSLPSHWCTLQVLEIGLRNWLHVAWMAQGYPALLWMARFQLQHNPLWTSASWLLWALGLGSRPSFPCCPRLFPSWSPRPNMAWSKHIFTGSHENQQTFGLGRWWEMYVWCTVFLDTILYIYNIIYNIVSIMYIIYCLRRLAIHLHVCRFGDGLLLILFGLVWRADNASTSKHHKIPQISL